MTKYPLPVLVVNCNFHVLRFVKLGFKAFLKNLSEDVLYQNNFNNLSICKGLLNESKISSNGGS